MIDIGVKTTSSSINLIKQAEEGQVQSDSLMTLTSESFSIRKVLFQNYFSATIFGFFISMTMTVSVAFLARIHVHGHAHETLVVLCE